MTRFDRQNALNAIDAGDLIFGVGAGGQPKILLVYLANKRQFAARHITTGMEIEFDRDGNSKRLPDGGTCTIVSTAALPASLREVALGLDRKMRNAGELTDFKLSEAEIKLLLSVKEFYRSRPLPEN